MTKKEAFFEAFFDPKASCVLEKWLDGNRIYVHEKPRTDFRFGPGTAEGAQHFTFDLRKMEEWFKNPSQLLGRWDGFEDTSYSDESRMNTITRLIIVALVLLVIVGVSGWVPVLIVGFFLLLILWYTLIPSVHGAIRCKKTPKVLYPKNQKDP